MLGHFLTPKSSQVCSNFVKLMRDFRFTLPGVSNDLERMSFELKIRTPAEDFLTFTVDIGRPLFILGANGSGKSSLMHALYLNHAAQVICITAHRQTWFDSNAPTRSARETLQWPQNLRGNDSTPNARWVDSWAQQLTAER